MGRAPCCDRAAVKRGPWSPEEDDALRDYMQRHDKTGSWITLPNKAGECVLPLPCPSVPLIDVWHASS